MFANYAALILMTMNIGMMNSRILESDFQRNHNLIFESVDRVFKEDAVKFVHYLNESEFNSKPYNFGISDVEFKETFKNVKFNIEFNFIVLSKFGQRVCHIEGSLPTNKEMLHEFILN